MNIRNEIIGPEEALRRAVEEARRAADAGDVVSHEEVREWLKALAEGRKVPRPRAKNA